MATATPPIWREGRAAGELAGLLRSPIWSSPPRAPVVGQPVLLVPGLLASDSTLTLMARWLKRAGYAPRRAGIAVNVDCSEAEMGRLVERLERSTARASRPAVVIGHSRGGVFARALAVRRPDLVSGIVTMGSPLVDPLRNVHPFLHLQLELLSSLGDLGLGRVLRHTCADRQLFDEIPVHPLSRALLRRARRRHEAAAAAGEACCTEFWQDFRAPFPSDRVKFVSLYSKTDGIVHYESCLDPAAEHIEVAGTHCGMAASAPVYTCLSKVLAQMTTPDAGRLAA